MVFKHVCYILCVPFACFSEAVAVSVFSDSYSGDFFIKEVLGD